MPKMLSAAIYINIRGGKVESVNLSEQGKVNKRRHQQ